LAQAAAVIIDQAISCAEYRRWFADRARSLEELFPADAEADGYAKTVATTWALAINAGTGSPRWVLAGVMAFLVAVLDPAWHNAAEIVEARKALRAALDGQPSLHAFHKAANAPDAHWALVSLAALTTDVAGYDRLRNCFLGAGQQHAVA
jgi:hypothetical protein